ncbi:Conserved protein of unknown function [Modestobacter italicus]|uniref:Glycoprotein n=1 Tax=Modestobacter italicus (strain DSM 44449 / CECT 9708 / BC 501) TaxID=2732864 RepID=I4F5N6_MODI5|nr:DUF6049 family protein [Modestobacter marinus]CCH90949.1 Conserved protein of unknown function [Modestobacter marinus]
MRRRAAGRADGRHSTPSLLLVAGAALLAGLPAAPAAAAPALASAPDGRPVQITVDRLEPRTVVPGSPIEVSGTLVNDSTETWSDLTVRVQRGDVLTSRDALVDELADPDEATTATAPFRELDGDLEPGDTLQFSYATTAEELQLTEDGVYPLLVNLNGTREDGDPERVGQLSTQLVVGQPLPAARTSVAWLWPITDRPHRDASGGFADDDLAGEVADGGRLDRAVRVLEDLPTVPGADPAETDPAVPVTLAVDPALLEELSLMAVGPYTVGDDEGTGTADAGDLLDRLRTVAEEHPVVALPYADVDADALVATGQSAVVTRSLPGTAEGTAQQPADDGGALTPADPGAGSTDGAAETGAGAAIVREVLGVTPRTDLAWAAGGALSGPTLDTLQAGGVDTVVLSDQGLADGDRAVGVGGAPAAARSSQPAAAGDVTTLVADSRLSEVVAEATPDSGQGRLTEQRYLAELGALTRQLAAREAGTQQTVLVTPPRAVDPDPAVLTAMMTDTATQPWLAAVGVDALTTGPEVATGDLVDSTAALPAAGMTEIAETSRVRDDFAAAVVGDPATVLAGTDAAIARAASAEWRGDDEGFAAAAADLQDTVADLRGQVTLLSPVDGTYSLASSDAPLVLTVQNDLPFAVDVRLELRTRDNVGLTTEDIGVTTLQPSSRTPLQVPAHVRQSGGFAVSARLTTPGGGPLGETVTMQVKSTAYGWITLGITFGAAALLALLFLRRAVRFVLARRRGEPEDQAPLDAAVPPTRSPV